MDFKIMFNQQIFLLIKLYMPFLFIINWWELLMSQSFIFKRFW